MTAITMKDHMAAGWATIGGQRQAKPIEHDHQKPCCPICTAPAVAGYKWLNWSDLGHDCNCVASNYEAYAAGLLGLWRGRNALPVFVNSLPALYRGCTLESLRVTEANSAAIAGLQNWKGGNVYLYGQAGTGKTHLAVAYVRHQASRGKTAKFWGVANLFQTIREGFQNNTPAPDLTSWDFLLLDDIDKIRPTPFVYETLYGVLEARWANQKPTFFTSQTNPEVSAVMLTPEGSEGAADPIASRLASGQTYKFTGADQRFGGNA